MKLLYYLCLSFVSVLFMLTGYLIIFEDKYIPKTALLILLYYVVMLILQKRIAKLMGAIAVLFHLIYLTFGARFSSDVSPFDFLYSLNYLDKGTVYPLAQKLVLLLLLVCFISSMVKKKRK